MQTKCRCKCGVPRQMEQRPASASTGPFFLQTDRAGGRLSKTLRSRQRRLLAPTFTPATSPAKSTEWIALFSRGDATRTNLLCEPWAPGERTASSHRTSRPHCGRSQAASGRSAAWAPRNRRVARSLRRLQTWRSPFRCSLEPLMRILQPRFEQSLNGGIRASRRSAWATMNACFGAESGTSLAAFVGPLPALLRRSLH
jgi:hypothetical protein